jgi:HlyD family secretion protein
VDLDHATIRSPIDGVVVSRSIDLGQTVAASLQAPKLFVIAGDLAQMQVESKIDEADIGRMRPGLSVSFTVDAFPDRTFEGKVAQVRLEPLVEAGVVSYTTVIRTGNPDLQLRPGMTANVSVLIERRDDVLRIPNAALRFRPPSPVGGRGGAIAAAAPGSPGSRGSGGEARAATRTDAAGSAGAQDTAGARAGRGRGGQAAAGGQEGDLVRRGAAGRDARGLRTVPESVGGDGAGGADGYKPGAVYLLKDGKPDRVMVLIGITDGSFTEVRSDRLKPGDKVIVGSETQARNASLQPPPGMGGPGMRGPGGGGRR